MDDQNKADAILNHLRIVAHSKRAMLQVAVDITREYPTQAATLVAIITSLTRSADGLLGDTNVGPLPSILKDTS